MFSEKRVVHEKNTVEEELEKTPTVTGEMHIRHDEDGSLTFTHPEVCGRASLPFCTRYAITQFQYYNISSSQLFYCV